MRMFAQLKYRLTTEHRMAAIGLGIVGAISLASALGLFEGLELGILDRFFRLRAPHANREERILVVTIGEGDIARAGKWPISDGTLASLIERIGAHNPASIGLDLYRNLPVEPGVDELIEVLETTPNAIGIERSIGETVPPHPTLLKLDQVSSSDLVLDDGGRVRRGLLSAIAPTGEVKQTLAATLALEYLSALGIELEALDASGLLLQVGKGRVERFEKNDGGYVNADAGGFQVLMNYRGSYQKFDSVSMSAVLAGEVSEEMVRDRIVLIGATAVSTNDWFSTPVGGDRVAGVYIHAHLLSQLLELALEGKPFLRTVPDYLEWLWVCLWMGVSVLASRSVLYSRSLKLEVSAWLIAGRLLGVSVGLGVAGYGLFLLGWWLPVALPAVSMAATMAVGVGYRNQQLQQLAAFDPLTQVANRGYFDQHLVDMLKLHEQLSLILCDVDHFKAYNDLYGHPAGDRCLQQVARAIQMAVRDSDLVARYGGEEFAIVLPGTTPDVAAGIAERVQQQMREQAIAHEGSQVRPWVTLSCGSASVSSGFVLPAVQLIEYADRALYQAKQTGRNRTVISDWQTRSEDGDMGSSKVA